MTEYEYVAARDKIYGKWRGPYKARIKDDTLFWGFGGFSRMDLPGEEDFEILKSYGWLDEDDDWEEVDGLDEQFGLDFPPRDAIEDSAGWLSPEGKFYPCEYGGHISLEYDLCMAFGLGRKSLQEQGWARIDAEMIMWGELGFRNPKLKQAQLVTLLKLWSLGGGYLDRNEIAEVLEDHGWKVPSE